MQTLSYFTPIRISGKTLKYYPTSSFSINGNLYSGVITFGAATNFLVDQTPTYNRVKIDQNQYITLVTYNASLPADVKSLLPADTTTFFTTSLNEARYFFVTTFVTPTQSTVDLHINTSFYICLANTSSFWSANNNLSVSQNNGGLVTMNQPTIDNTYGGAGSGVPVDPSGNQVLTTPPNIADFTASPLGPILGAINTGVLMPGFARTNTFMVGVPGKEMRYMPYGNIITPDVSQSSIGSRGLFGGGGLLTATGPVGSFGKAISITDYLSVFAASAPVATTGFVRIYTLSFPAPVLAQQINATAGETIGDSLIFNTDGSVLIFNSHTAAGSRIKIYIMTALNVWAEIPVQLPLVVGDITLANSSARLGMSKDGRTIVCNTFPAKNLFVYEDTSVPGDWSSYYVNNLTSSIAGLSVRAVAISSEGSWVWAIVESAPGIFNTFALFKRCKYNNWVKTYEGILLGPYLGTDASIIKTGYNGLFTVVGDFTLIANDPGSMGLAAIPRLSDTTLIYVPVRGTPLTTPAINIAANSNMTLMTVVDTSNTITNLGRIGSIIQEPINQVTPATNIESCTFADSNFGSIGFFGEPTTGTVYIITTSNNPMNLLFGAAQFDFKNFNTDNKILALRSTDESSALTSNVNPGTPNVTDLGAPAARWKDIYFSNALYLPGNTTDSAFASGTAVPTLIGTAAGLVVDYTTQLCGWSRSGNNVELDGYININNVTANPPGGTSLQIELDQPIPNPALNGAIPGILTTESGALLPTTYNFYCRIYDSTHIGFYTTDAGGNQVSFTCGAGDPAPSLGISGSIYFVINYRVSLT